MSDIVTVTLNPTVDKTATVETVVAERKLRCDAPRFEPGGGGINVSRAIKRLGGESLAVYAAGGPTGDRLERLLQEEGVAQQRVVVEHETRQNLIVDERSTGRQFRFGMPGARLSDDEWQRCLEAAIGTGRPAFIVASGSLPPGVPTDSYARLGKAAREAGARLVLDTRGEPLKTAVRDGAFLVKPNARELAELAGAEFESEESQERLARTLIEQGCCEMIVVSLGAAGALWASSEDCEYIRTPAVPIRSKVGAGDSMVAGIVLGMQRGMARRDAIRFGVAAGAAAVMTPGTELCRREDAERLYERIHGGVL